MTKRLIATCLLSIGLILTGCSKDTAKPAANETPTTPSTTTTTAPAKSNQPMEMNIATDQDPVGFDPHKVPAASSLRIYSLIYDTLTRLDADLNIIPSLATKWTVSPDGKTVTFDLQKGVKFHNGREMTSADVKFSFDRILDAKTAALAKSYFTSVEAIETPDPYQVVFKLKNIDSALIANVTSIYTAIVPKEVADLNKEMVGTGPFKIGAIEAGQSVTLTKNPNYFVKDMPKADTIKFRVMKDEAERLAAVRTGKVDLTTVSADSAKLLEKTKGVTIQDYQTMEYGYLGINTTKKPFDDVRVRQALSYAVDRSEIVKTVWKDQGQVTGPISPVQKAYALNASDLPKKDIDKAKQLLKDAGYEKGFETVIQTASTYPDMIESAQVIQQQLKAIGINAKIEQLEWAKYIETWKSKEMTLLIGRNTAGTDPDRSLRFFFSTSGGANVWNYSNKDFDALTQKALETNDLEQRKKLYVDAQKMLINDSPNLFLASPKYFYAVSERLDGFVPNAASEAYAIMKTAIKNK
ncbi:ABC transporter substrate-binding protein [Paenibacillus sp. LMG 31456]|uniref:ABC transporter substrate-binding protein n=1 Tax=Paenibacillus foliorum TaxID=2654974 RepID=A0A972GRV0_9BACL|nr:ABC transporter substrate-binding protein [Paenibacillus foliorum]